ncbi:MAG: heme ABC exporter ATP-binding protein CcmA [Gammaproteobacteria bacterium]|nr:heme ABC exporter ATP-binding protein CcmA [Gammaproteobacteria bacterium]
MDPRSTSLELTGVELARGGRPLIAGLSFKLGPAQLALVTGPNGSGKTTLLRTLAGLARPSGGEIRLGDAEVASLDHEQRAAICYQGHLDGLKKDLSVEENILFFSEIRDYSNSYSSVLQQLGLETLRDRSVRHLSAGQRRRTALAVLKLSGATLWLLDEPLTNLDQAGRALVASWLDEHLTAGGMAVVATHLADELKRPGCLLVEL